jgi:small neutral amino acid transporter SnatA (MarC family)
VIDLLGHLFYVFLIVGQLMVAKRSTAGWMVRILGSTGWAILGVFIGLSSIVIWSAVFALADGYGYLKWRSHEH